MGRTYYELTKNLLRLEAYGQPSPTKLPMRWCGSASVASTASCEEVLTSGATPEEEDVCSHPHLFPSPAGLVRVGQLMLQAPDHSTEEKIAAAAAILTHFCNTFCLIQAFHASR